MAFNTLIIATLLLATLAKAQDPTCSTGVKSSGACCPAGCGTCGGADCGPRGRMLKLKCCIGGIKNGAANCLTSNPPCKITTRDPDFMAGSEVPDPKCLNGLRRARACCPAECSECGGAMCRKRGALIGSLCCPAAIKASPRGCKDTGAPCALYRNSMAPTEPSPMAMEPTPAAVEPTPASPVDPTPMPFEPTPMPAEPTPMMVEPTPMAVEMTPEPAPLPRACKSMRTMFVDGCFCYLLFSGKIRVRRGKVFRMRCRQTRTKVEIRSMAFKCRRFVNGANAGKRVERIIKRLNMLITLCLTDVPMIELRA